MALRRKKHLSFLNTDGTLEEILKVFEDEEIHLDLDLQAKLTSFVTEREPKASVAISEIALFSRRYVGGSNLKWRLKKM